MLSTDTLDAVDRAFAVYHGEGESPDVAYGVVHDGALIHSGGLRAAGSESPVGPDSIWRIASMTKSFTAAAVLQLRDAGRLALDEPVVSYIPEVAAIAPATPDAPPLTLRMLLTMSGGLPWDDPWADRLESLTPDEFSALLTSGLRFSSVPGTMFEYSNLGYAIIGRAITNVTEAPYCEVVRTGLIDPLGLADTRFFVDELDPALVVRGHRKFGDGWEPVPFDRPGEFSPIGGLYSSVRDLARWIGWFTDAFRNTNRTNDSPAVLSAASRREMQQFARLSGSATTPSGVVRPTGYGFGLNGIGDSRWGEFVSHSGGYPGYGSHMRWHPATGYGVIALGNVMYAGTRRPATDALDTIIAAVGAAPRSVAVWPETLACQAAVHRLLLRWDDALADDLFSPNIDLDQPRSRRRDAIATMLDGLGDIDPEPADVRSGQSAAEVSWTIRGSAGEATVELWVTPERNPKVHTLNVTAASDSTAAPADDSPE